VLLVGFNLTFAVHEPGHTIEITPLRGPVSLSRRYPFQAPLTVELIKEEFPDAQTFVDGGEIVVMALVEDQERLADMIQGKKPRTQEAPPRRNTKQVYTLRVEEQPVGAVLRQLGDRLGWTIVIDEASLTASGRSLNQRVSFAVQNVDEDALLAELLRPAGLDFERDGNRVTIRPDSTGSD
jgi:hypothetical protein